MRRIPRDAEFFDMFVEIANNVVHGAQVLSDLLSNYDYQQMPASVQRVTEIEHRGDDLTHRTLIKLNQAFLTPFSREDIRLLVASLDDVLDCVYRASDRLLNYKITQPSPSAKLLAGIILKQTQELRKAVLLLGKEPNLLEHCVEVSRLESEADRISREALGRLFDFGYDPITLIKLKEHLELLEAACDKAEDVANVLETIVLKKG